MRRARPRGLTYRTCPPPQDSGKARRAWRRKSAPRLAARISEPRRFELYTGPKLLRGKRWQCSGQATRTRPCEISSCCPASSNATSKPPILHDLMRCDDTRSRLEECPAQRICTLDECMQGPPALSDTACFPAQSNAPAKLGVFPSGGAGAILGQNTSSRKRARIADRLETRSKTMRVRFRRPLRRYFAF